VQPCLNGLIVTLSNVLPSAPALTSAQLRMLIADCPDLIPMLLPIATIPSCAAIEAAEQATSSVL
jgi:hypothetical protein